MIKAVYIEDEPRNIVLLRTFIETHCSADVELVGSATNLDKAYDLITSVKPQLVYLDIELNQGNAFELLEKLQNATGIWFEVIFITAFNEYAVKAFRQNAVDYILKPISIAELKHATAKAVEKINATKTARNITDVLEQLKQQTPQFKISVPIAEGVQFVNADDIIRLEAKGSYCIVYLVRGQKITCSKSLGEIEKLLSEVQFVRVHHSWVVNRKFLSKFYRGKESYIEMEDGSTVPVSSRKKGDFLDSIGL